MGFYPREELEKIGFKSLGENVLISDKTSIYSPEKISIGNNVRIDDFCILSGDIKIGNYVHIAAYCGFFGGGGIEIEDFAGISSRGIIYSVSDDYSGEVLTNPMIPEKYKKLKYGKVIIKKHSIVGSGTIILPGVILEEGTAIGANSLVLKSTEEWGIYAGSPIKKIKNRKKDLLILEQKFLDEKEERKL
ncbi:MULTISPECIES: acyltransferase [Fusobacterium]|uniref:acyltransferase n=1 Tax=Fusobacterium TaxID=848 RepID=UPI001476E35C|nr:MULTISPECIES: acyltransferase [Fusobacterium]NME35788.1 acyltransferase [Fusobacterium sp. FSA-380-WT-3A]